MLLPSQSYLAHPASAGPEKSGRLRRPRGSHGPGNQYHVGM